jgi:hypothetical protein
MKAAAGAALVAPRAAFGSARQVGPPSTITIPPRDFGPNAPPTTYCTDPDVITVDPLFNMFVFDIGADNTASNDVGVLARRSEALAAKFKHTMSR